MDTMKLLHSIIAESEGDENLEKLDYLRNLQSIREKLRAKTFEQYNNSVGHWSLDLETKEFFCCDRLAHLYSDKAHPDHPIQKYHDLFMGTESAFEPECIEHKVKINGKTYFIKESINFIENKNILLGVVQDLTVIKTLQKNLENIDKVSHQLMELFDKNIIIFQCSKEGIVTFASSAFSQLSGFDTKDILKQPLSTYQQENNGYDLKEIFKKLGKSRLSWKGELKLKKKNGEAFWVKAFISPIYNPYDKLTDFTVICHDITTQKVLEQVTNYDPLTDIYNRRYYGEIIPKEINRAKRHGHNLTFAMVDIDYFKQYNDIYGHVKGDEALTKVAQTLKDSLRRGEDLVFRMGGEEFCIVSSGLDTQKSVELCHTLKKKIEDLKIPHLGSNISRYLTISIGLVVADVKNEVIDDMGLYTIADNALYSAKAKGRNAIFLHPTDEMDIF